jgi:hypothetical protein
MSAAAAVRPPGSPLARPNRFRTTRLNIKLLYTFHTDLQTAAAGFDDGMVPREQAAFRLSLPIASRRSLAAFSPGFVSGPPS